MEELAAELPAHLRLGTVGYRYPQWGALVFDEARSPDAITSDGIGEYSAQPLFRALGLPSRELVPNERELLWELLQLPDSTAPVVMLNPGLTTPVFPRRRLLDAANGEVGDAGHFNPSFLDPRLFRDEVLPILEDMRSVRDGGELLVTLTVPALLEEAGIPPYPLLWRMERLATVVPEGVRIAVELREASYLTKDYADFLRDAGWLHVVSAWPGMPAFSEQWDLGERAVRGEKGPPRLVRLASPRPASSPLGFSQETALHRPLEEQRQELARCIVGDESRETIVLASNAFEGCAPLTLEALGEAILDVGTSA